MKYIIRSTCLAVFQRVSRTHLSGVGKDAVFAETYSGWYASLANIGAIYLGEERPELEAGNPVRITVERG